MAKMTKNDPSCETKKSCDTGEGCAIAAFFIPAIAVFVTIFFFEWLFHGMFLRSAYEATASIWRNEEDIRKLSHICLIREMAMAGVITVLFTFSTEFHPEMVGTKQHLYHGARFGLLIGLLLGISQFGSYVYLPISFGMAAWWLVGEVMLGLLIGLALPLSYCISNRKCSGK